MSQRISKCPPGSVEVPEMNGSSLGNEDRSASGSIPRVECLSIAAPAYNEAEGIESVVRQWIDYLKGLPAIERFEVVVCNDGSRDDRGAILDRIAALDPRLEPVHQPRNQGAAAALTAAIRHTREDWVLLLDSDGQFPIENLPRLIAAVEAAQA